MTAPGPGTNVYTHYNSGLRKNRGVYMRKALINKISELPDPVIQTVRGIIYGILDKPLNCGQETLSYIYGSNLHVLWESGFYILYRYHKPSTGAYANHDYLVHVLDIGDFFLDEDGNRRLDIYEDPEALRTLAERDGTVIPDPRAQP